MRRHYRQERAKAKQSPEHIKHKEMNKACEKYLDKKEPGRKRGFNTLCFMSK